MSKQTLPIQTTENPQPDELMNDDVTIGAFKENDSDKETAEINDSLKIDNEEKNTS